MISCSSELRRCRPCLGTLVEVTVECADPAGAHDGIESAYQAVMLVQKLMSAHDARSELSVLNRTAHLRAVKVHPWVYEVLQEAETLRVRSAGLFNVAVGGELERLGYLPETGESSTRGAGTFHTDEPMVELMSGHRVRFARALRLDLGGIAKGFAVDQAVLALERAGFTNGMVNAGGDLRVFGPRPRRIHIRHPETPGELLPLLEISNRALCTSADYFSRKTEGGREVTPLIDPRTGESSGRRISVSVAAQTALHADALTKVVTLAGSEASAVLEDYGAHAFILQPDRPPALLGAPLYE